MLFTAWRLRNFVIEGVACQPPLEESASHSSITNFLNGRTIRSKKYPNKVLDFHFYGWKQRGLGKVYLYDHHGKPNQRWKLVNGELILEYQKLRLTKEDGLAICCDSADAEKNQKWTLEVTSKRFVNFNYLMNSGANLTRVCYMDAF